MTTTVAIMGAGGKMGFRLTQNLMGTRYAVRHVEISDAGKARLAAIDVRPVAAEERPSTAPTPWCSPCPTT